MKIWDDTTKIKGKYVAKDVYANVGFLLGLFLMLASVIKLGVVDADRCKQGYEALFVLVTALKGIKSYQAIKSSCEDDSADNSANLSKELIGE